MNLWTYWKVPVNHEPVNLWTPSGVPVNLWTYLGCPVNLWTYFGVLVNLWTCEPMNLFGGPSEPLNLWTYLGIPVNLWTYEPMNLFGVPVNLWNREPMNLLGVPANLWTYEPIGGSQWTYEPMKLFGGASESWNVWTYLGVLVERVWEDLGSQNGALLAPKFDHNSILCWKCCKAKIAYKTNRIVMIFEVEGVYFCKFCYISYICTRSIKQKNLCTRSINNILIWVTPPA